MRGRRLWAAAALAAAPLAAAGCYRYVPAGPAPEAGTEVRATLAPPQTLRLAALEARDVAVVEGAVVRTGADTVWLSALRLTTGYGEAFLPSGETVALPRPALLELRERRVDAQRSGLAVAAALALAVAAQYAWTRGFGRQTDEPHAPVAVAP